MSEVIDRPAAFLTTRWTMIVDAQGSGGPKAYEALSRLCQIYWRPVYHFMRLRGHSPHDAEDYTQGFFEALIEKNYLKSVDQERGKFRSFVMAAAKHYLADQFDRQSAWKRGGRATLVSLDLEDAESYVENELATGSDAEEVFDRVWASTLLDRALLKLRQLYEKRGKLSRFELLRPCLIGVSSRSYAELADELAGSEDMVKTEVKRMRQCFRRILRSEVAETVSDPSELETEIRYLGSLL